MILDILDNADRYLPLNRGFEKAFKFLSQPDLENLPLGRYEIDGDSVYAIIAKENGRRKEDCRLETHTKYIDIQFVLSGIDTMGWKPRASCGNPAQEYDEKKDIEFFSDEPDTWCAVRPGAFTIFFPEDAHLPLISDGPIHKVIVKVAEAP